MQQVVAAREQLKEEKQRFLLHASACDPQECEVSDDDNSFWSDGDDGNLPNLSVSNTGGAPTVEQDFPQLQKIAQSVQSLVLDSSKKLQDRTQLDYALAAALGHGIGEGQHGFQDAKQYLQEVLASLHGDIVVEGGPSSGTCSAVDTCAATSQQDECSDDAQRLCAIASHADSSKGTRSDLNSINRATASTAHDTFSLNPSSSPARSAAPQNPRNEADNTDHTLAPPLSAANGALALHQHSVLQLGSMAGLPEVMPLTPSARASSLSSEAALQHHASMVHAINNQNSLPMIATADQLAAIASAAASAASTAAAAVLMQHQQTGPVRWTGSHAQQFHSGIHQHGDMALRSSDDGNGTRGRLKAKVEYTPATMGPTTTQPSAHQAGPAQQHTREANPDAQPSQSEVRVFPAWQSWREPRPAAPPLNPALDHRPGLQHRLPDQHEQQTNRSMEHSSSMGTFIDISHTAHQHVNRAPNTATIGFRRLQEPPVSAKVGEDKHFSPLHAGVHADTANGIKSYIPAKVAVLKHDAQKASLAGGASQHGSILSSPHDQPLLHGAGHSTDCADVGQMPSRRDVVTVRPAPPGGDSVLAYFSALRGSLNSGPSGVSNTSNPDSTWRHMHSQHAHWMAGADLSEYSKGSSHIPTHPVSSTASPAGLPTPLGAGHTAPSATAQAWQGLTSSTLPATKQLPASLTAAGAPDTAAAALHAHIMKMPASVPLLLAPPTGTPAAAATAIAATRQLPSDTAQPQGMDGVRLVPSAAQQAVEEHSAGTQQGRGLPQELAASVTEVMAFLQNPDELPQKRPMMKGAVEKDSAEREEAARHTEQILGGSFDYRGVRDQFDQIKRSSRLSKLKALASGGVTTTLAPILPPSRTVVGDDEDWDDEDAYAEVVKQEVSYRIAAAASGVRPARPSATNVSKAGATARQPAPAPVLSPGLIRPVKASQDIRPDQNKLVFKRVPAPSSYVKQPLPGPAVPSQTTIPATPVKPAGAATGSESPTSELRKVGRKKMKAKPTIAFGSRKSDRESEDKVVSAPKPPRLKIAGRPHLAAALPTPTVQLAPALNPDEQKSVHAVLHAVLQDLLSDEEPSTEDSYSDSDYSLPGTRPTSPSGITAAAAEGAVDSLLFSVMDVCHSGDSCPWDFAATSRSNTTESMVAQEAQPAEEVTSAWMKAGEATSLQVQAEAAHDKDACAGVVPLGSAGPAPPVSMTTTAATALSAVQQTSRAAAAMLEPGTTAGSFPEPGNAADAISGPGGTADAIPDTGGAIQDPLSPAGHIQDPGSTVASTVHFDPYSDSYVTATHTSTTQLPPSTSQPLAGTTVGGSTSSLSATGTLTQLTNPGQTASGSPNAQQVEVETPKISSKINSAVTALDAETNKASYVTLGYQAQSGNLPMQQQLYSTQMSSAPTCDLLSFKQVQQQPSGKTIGSSTMPPAEDTLLQHVRSLEAHNKVDHQGSDSNGCRAADHGARGSSGADMLVHIVQDQILDKTGAGYGSNRQSMTDAPKAQLGGGAAAAVALPAGLEHILGGSKLHEVIGASTCQTLDAAPVQTALPAVHWLDAGKANWSPGRTFQRVVDLDTPSSSRPPAALLRHPPHVSRPSPHPVTPAPAPGPSPTVQEAVVEEVVDDVLLQLLQSTLSVQQESQALLPADAGAMSLLASQAVAEQVLVEAVAEEMQHRALNPWTPQHQTNTPPAITSSQFLQCLADVIMIDAADNTAYHANCPDPASHPSTTHQPIPGLMLTSQSHTAGLSMGSPPNTQTVPVPQAIPAPSSSSCQQYANIDNSLGRQAAGPPVQMENTSTSSVQLAAAAPSSHSQSLALVPITPPPATQPASSAQAVPPPSLPAALPPMLLPAAIPNQLSAPLPPYILIPTALLTAAPTALSVNAPIVPALSTQQLSDHSQGDLQHAITLYPTPHPINPTGHLQPVSSQTSHHTNAAPVYTLLPSPSHPTSVPAFPTAPTAAAGEISRTPGMLEDPHPQRGGVRGGAVMTSTLSGMPHMLVTESIDAGSLPEPRQRLAVQPHAPCTPRARHTQSLSSSSSSDLSISDCTISMVQQKQQGHVHQAAATSRSQPHQSRLLASDKRMCVQQPQPASTSLRNTAADDVDSGKDFSPRWGGIMANRSGFDKPAALRAGMGFLLDSDSDTESDWSLMREPQNTGTLHTATPTDSQPRDSNQSGGKAASGAAVSKPTEQASMQASAFGRVPGGGVGEGQGPTCVIVPSASRQGAAPVLDLPAGPPVLRLRSLDIEHDPTREGTADGEVGGNVGQQPKGTIQSVEVHKQDACQEAHLHGHDAQTTAESSASIHLMTLVAEGHEMRTVASDSAVAVMTGCIGAGAPGGSSPPQSSSTSHSIRDGADTPDGRMRSSSGFNSGTSSYIQSLEEGLSSVSVEDALDVADVDDTIADDLEGRHAVEDAVEEDSTAHDLRTEIKMKIMSVNGVRDLASSVPQAVLDQDAEAARTARDPCAASWEHAQENRDIGVTHSDAPAPGSVACDAAPPSTQGRQVTDVGVVDAHRPTQDSRTCSAGPASSAGHDGLRAASLLQYVSDSSPRVSGVGNRWEGVQVAPPTDCSEVGRGAGSKAAQDREQFVGDAKMALDSSQGTQQGGGLGAPGRAQSFLQSSSAAPNILSYQGPLSTPAGRLWRAKPQPSLSAPGTPRDAPTTDADSDDSASDASFELGSRVDSATSSCTTSVCDDPVNEVLRGGWQVGGAPRATGQGPFSSGTRIGLNHPVAQSVAATGSEQAGQMGRMGQEHGTSHVRAAMVRLSSYSASRRKALQQASMQHPTMQDDTSSCTSSSLGWDARDSLDPAGF